jgi:hypothetical protein
VSITALRTSIFLAGKTLPFFDKEVGKILDFFFLSENLTNFSKFWGERSQKKKIIGKKKKKKKKKPNRLAQARRRDFLFPFLLFLHPVGSLVMAKHPNERESCLLNKTQERSCI